MKDELFSSKKVNPRWLRQHIIGLLNKIYDLVNEPEFPNEREMLIQALIENEWYRYKLPKDWD